MCINQQVAAEEGLRYVTDATPGITRRRCGKGFAYYHPGGRRVTEAAVLARIRSLVIPPAYRDVWICPYASGHLQATGIDARGRKQYRYHPRWRAARDATKFTNIVRFGDRLAAIRRRVQEDLGRPGLPREKVLAAVVLLLDKTRIRVGNAEYARENHSYGLTTLHKKHVAVEGATIRFEFTGKSGKRWNLAVHDRRIAAVVRRCEDLPGYELFKYLDDAGERHAVDSAHVNEYLKEISGEDFTAKDFRTWAGTVLAAAALREIGTCDGPTQQKRNLVRAVEQVARLLGNTPTVCRKCYVHPEVFNTYLDGGLAAALGQELAGELHDDGLSEEEVRVLAFLRRRLEAVARLTG